ncbi:MAG TPA: 16S rRNA (cytosine(1402)-N(4))-methyltransferase, partial [Phycisphaerales bacterium]|nr:16S rRNA (cytosine(1402)-N(4))-methyltransferase [Phycisphaerales bacterium]
MPAMDCGGEHQTVLRAEAVELLQPARRCVLVDCTVGLGGHSEALLAQAGSETILIGIDVDEDNLVKAKQRLAPYAGRVRMFRANFDQLDTVLAEAALGPADAILADLGVASSQLDDPARG